MLAMLVFDHTYQVLTAATGTGDRLTLPAFLDLFQDLAGRHAQAMGVGINAMLERGVAWVLNRMYVETGTLPRIGETLRIETWPSGVDRLYAWRDVMAIGKNGHVLARGTTRWLKIDVAKRRPLRMDNALADFVSPDRPAPLPLPERRIQALAPESATLLNVRYADLDANGHANNVQYARWMVEAFGEAFLALHTQTMLDCTVRAETLRGDVLHSEVAAVRGEPGLFQHRIKRPADEREVALGWSRWKRD